MLASKAKMRTRTGSVCRRSGGTMLASSETGVDDRDIVRSVGWALEAVTGGLRRVAGRIKPLWASRSEVNAGEGYARRKRCGCKRERKGLPSFVLIDNCLPVVSSFL